MVAVSTTWTISLLCKQPFIIVVDSTAYSAYDSKGLTPIVSLRVYTIGVEGFLSPNRPEFVFH